MSRDPVRVEPILERTNLFTNLDLFRMTPVNRTLLVAKILLSVSVLLLILRVIQAQYARPAP
jgi:hypothetical protein